MYNIITSDQSWLHSRHIDVEQLNKGWAGQGQSRKTVTRKGHFHQKSLFSIYLNRNKIVLISRLERGKTINHGIYMKNALGLFGWKLY